MVNDKPIIFNDKPIIFFVIIIAVFFFMTMYKLIVGIWLFEDYFKPKSIIRESTYYEFYYLGLPKNNSLSQNRTFTIITKFRGEEITKIVDFDSIQIVKHQMEKEVVNDYNITQKLIK